MRDVNEKAAGRGDAAVRAFLAHSQRAALAGASHAHLASLGLLLSSAFRASPSNPALRILLRAFELARITSPSFARTVARLARPVLAKQPGRSLRLAAFELARDAR